MVNILTSVNILVTINMYMFYAYRFICIYPHAYGVTCFQACYQGRGREAYKGLTEMGTLECWGGTDVITAAHSQVHLFTMRSFFCMLMSWRIQSNV